MASSSVKGMTIDIGANTSAFQLALSKLNTSISKTQSSLSKVNSLLKFDPKNVTLLTNKQELLTQKIAQSKKKIDEIESALKEYDSTVKSNSDITDEQRQKYINLTTELEKEKSALKNLKAEYSNFGSVAGQVVQQVGKEIKSAGEKISDFGVKFSKLSGIAVASIGAMVKESMNFEDAWVGVTKTVDGTDSEMDNVRQSILNLAKATGTASEEIAGVAETAGQLGVKVNDISKFTEVMVRLGDSTNLTAEEASSAIAKLYNVMGEDLSTVDKFGATLVALGNNAATTESDILNMATRIAASGKQVGLSNQEVLALATSLSSVGLEAEAGGSAISAIITQIDKDVATGSDNLKEWAKVSGLSVKEFKKLWSSSSIDGIQKVINGMGNAKDAGKNLNVILDDLGISSLRQTDTMKRLSNASELMADMIQLSNKSWDENIALTEESEKKYQTTSRQIAQIKESIKEIAITMGEQFLPIIQNIVEKLKVWTEKFSNLSDGTKKAIASILLFIAALGPVIIVIGKVISAIGIIVTQFGVFIGWIAKAKAAITALSVSLSLPIAPILLVVAAVAAVVAALVILYNKCDWFRDGVNKIVENIKEFFIGLFENIKELFTVTIPNIFDKFTNEILPNLPYYIGFYLGQAIGNFINFVSETKRNLQEKVPQIIENVVQFFRELPSKIYDSIIVIKDKIGEWAVAMISKAQEELPKVIEEIKSFFEQLPAKMIKIGEAIVEGIWEGIKNKITWLKNKVNDMSTGLVDGVRSVLKVNSPSKVFRDKVGSPIAEGIGVRI